MKKSQLILSEKIHSLQEYTTQLQLEYWLKYSSFGTWQFWVILLIFFIAPLVVLYFKIDRKKIFLLGFYGFNIHVWYRYMDVMGLKTGFWGYNYELIPFLSGNVTISAAIVPVVYMLVYQWTINNNKNFYLYSIIVSLFFAFIFKPLLKMHQFFVLDEAVTFVHMFVVYCFVFILSKGITNIFLWMQKQ